MGLFSNLLSYGEAVGAYWFAIISWVIFMTGDGANLFGFKGWLDRRIDTKPRRLIEVSVMVAVMFWAGFQAWKDEHQRAEYASGRVQYWQGVAAARQEQLNQGIVPKPSSPPMGGGKTVSAANAADFVEVVQWGLNKGALCITIDTHKLAPLRSKYRIALVAMQFSAKRDMKDDVIPTVSEPFDISFSNVEMCAERNAAYLSNLEMGKGTSYIAILLPNGVSPRQFKTFRKAGELGVWPLSANTGPG